MVEMVALFFDLVFVLAITQLSHTLLAELSPANVLRVGLMLVTMWWLYFAAGAEHAHHRFVHAQDPGRQARIAYTYLHVLIVA
nr:low temperature requirement protein A [uncultured Albidiferax sp.]